jgi:carbon monoxide dehydrogenase subunit G
MELTDEQFLPLPRHTVWAALNDPQILQASVPGCESLEAVEHNQFKVVLAATVGPIKARFSGRLELKDLHANESYALAFEGSGGAAGSCKGSAKVQLHDAEGGTRLVYFTQAQVGGRLAQVGARLIDGVAKKMAGEFFARFTAAAMAGQPAAGLAVRAGAPAATKASHAGTADTAGAGRNWLWAAALALVVVAVVLYSKH